MRRARASTRATGAVVTRRPLEHTFYGLAFSPSGDRLYVSAQDMYAVGTTRTSFALPSMHEPEISRTVP